ALSGATSVALLLVLYLMLYKPMSGTSIGDWWVRYGASLGGDRSLGDLLLFSFDQLRAGLMGSQVWLGAPEARGAALAVLALGTVVGAVGVARRWPWLLVIVVSGFVLAIPASALMRWPMTIERVNLCWQVFLFTLVGFGLVR